MQQMAQSLSNINPDTNDSSPAVNGRLSVTSEEHYTIDGKSNLF